MREPRLSPVTVGRRSRSVLIAASLAVVAVAVVGCIFIESLIDGRPSSPAPSGPVATDSQTPVPSTSPTSPSTPAPSAPPPAGPGLVGDYRCLTLADATAAIERDGYEVGTVSYSIEGGAVDATWLVDVQDPPPGEAAAPGTPVDLLLASPFNVCRPSPGP
jgi:hypothetical protein